MRKKWPPLESGTMVRTTEPNMDKRGEWTDEAWAQRKWGVEGPIVSHSDSHGLCYKVLHPDNTFGYYDPSELQVVEVIRQAA